MDIHVPPSLLQFEPLLDGLEIVVQAAAKAARRKYRAYKRRKSYAALKPGADTPYWNELARACEQCLPRYGDKARLARMLGLPRQRVHQLLVAKTACADAERTLQLLVWLMARRRGFDRSF